MMPLIAIVIPDYEVVYRWARKHIPDVRSFSPEFLYKNDDLKRAILDDLNLIASIHKLPPHTHVHRVHLENQLIPETLLLQRFLISKKFGKAIENLYREGDQNGLDASPSRRESMESSRHGTAIPDTYQGFLTDQDQSSLEAFKPTRRLGTLLLMWSVLVGLFYFFMYILYIEAE